MILEFWHTWDLNLNLRLKFHLSLAKSYIRPRSRWAAETAAGRSGRAGWAGGRLASCRRWPLTWLERRGPQAGDEGSARWTSWHSGGEKTGEWRWVMTLADRQDKHKNVNIVSPINHQVHSHRFTRTLSLSLFIFPQTPNYSFTQLIISQALSLDLVIIYLSAHLVITKTLINISDGVSCFSQIAINPPITAFCLGSLLACCCVSHTREAETRWTCCTPFN